MKKKIALTSTLIIATLTGLTTLILAAVPVRTLPNNGADDVAGNAKISISYDEPIDPASVDNKTFLAYSVQRGLVSGTYNVNGTDISFIPDTHFRAGELIMTVATSGIQNTGGASVTSRSWQFFAASAPAAGTFAASQSTNPMAARTRDTVVGDVDRDSSLDICLGNDSFPVIQNTCYLSSGETINFGNGADVTRSVALIDVDRDGDLDIAVGNDGLNVVYLNNGAGDFTAGQRVFGSASDNAEDLVVTDFNSDGWLDLATPWKVFLNNNGITFTGIEFNSDPSWETVSIDAADFDGDGDIDLVVGNSSSSVKNVIYLNDGSGNLGSSQLAFGQVGNDTRSVKFLDANQDGHIDVAEANFGQQNLVYFNNGAGSLSPTSIPFGTGTDHTEDVAAADFNGDGMPDIAVANRSQQNRVYFWDPVLGYTNESNFGPADDVSIALAVGDLDNDGDLDISVANYYQQSVAYFNGNLDTYTPTVDKSSISIAPYTAGSVVTWTITARQNGPTADLYVTDPLGPYFSYRSHSAEPALTATSTGTTFSGYWPNIALGQVVTLTLVTELAGTPATAPTNSAIFTTTDHLTPTQTLPAYPLCEGEPCQYFTNGTPPVVNKWGVSTEPYVPGSIVTWTITVTNKGAVDDFYITDPLGPEFEYVSHSAQPPLVETYATGPTFRGKWAAVGADQTATLTLTTLFMTSTTGLAPTNMAIISSTSHLTPTTTPTSQPQCGAVSCPFVGPGLALAPAIQDGSGMPGQTLAYNFILSNLGTLPNTASLNLSGAGNLELAAVTLASYARRPVTLNLTIPSGTLSGTILSSVISATGQSTTAEAAAITTVGLDPASGVVIDPVTVTSSSLTDPAGEPIIITHLITNTANFTDVVNLTTNLPTGWPGPATGPDITIGPGESLEITLVVTAPISATLTPSNTVDVTVAGSYGSISVQDTVIISPDPDADADGDGILNRYEERNGNGDNNDDDTDGDGLPDYLDPDDDGDGVWTRYEYPDLNGDGYPVDNLNTDGDSLPDYLDPDDDNDTRLTIDEAADPDGDGDPVDALDTDGDYIPNYLDGDDGIVSDADEDGIPDTTECSATPCVDSDNDGAPDYLDTDSDNDGVLDQYEYDKNSDSIADDTDGDGLPDYRDADDDGDGTPTAGEQPDPNGDGNPADAVDTDDDGIPDYLDRDDDGDGAAGGDSDLDGIPDAIECPSHPCLDSDGDGLPDYLDTDSDNDGVLDRYEYDKDNDGVADDTDLDGRPDYRDADDDGDGTPTADEQPDPNDDGNPSDAVDSNGNGTPDYLDPDEVPDTDGDGIPDEIECSVTPCIDSDGDGTPDYYDTDSDNDGVLDRYECPDPTSACLDTDGDGRPNYRDFDDDGDGVLTVLEEPDPDGDGNPADARDSDGDGISDYLDAISGSNGDSDLDGDGIPDVIECPATPCLDSDGDGTPDYLDTDSDNDGLFDRYEYDKNNDSIADDTDGDGLPDYRDPDDDGDDTPTAGEQSDPDGDGDPADAIDSDGDGIPDYLDSDDSGPGGGDSDGDGIPDDVECPSVPCVDTDGDGTPDYLDLDSDGDGVKDQYECPYQLCRDTDGDNKPDYLDLDDDNDGLPTPAENPDLNGDGNPADASDTDGDGIPDYLDPDDDSSSPGGGDSDGDGTSDQEECPGGVPCPDSDGDTIPDYNDPTNNPVPGLYLRLSENQVIVWQGVVTYTTATVSLPPLRVQPEQILTYTIAVSNTGNLTTTFQLTSSFSAGLDQPGRETEAATLPLSDGIDFHYIRQVVATNPTTITVRFEIGSTYGQQSLSLERVIERPDIYLPLIIKN